MENTNNPAQQRVDEQTGGPLEGMSPQYVNMPENNEDPEATVYTEFGVGGQPDIMNPGDEEATDTLLYTDNAVAQDAAKADSDDDEKDSYLAY